MFDPTAFDNMKVVIEGALYDLDLSGKIRITDRNDLVNLAKMSRRFDIAFSLPEDGEDAVFAKMEIMASLGQLTAELLPGSSEGKKAGCRIRLQFVTRQAEKTSRYQEIQALMLEIWDSTRTVTQSVHSNPLDPGKNLTHFITIEFDRVIGEEQLDDLLEMTNYMVETMRLLQSLNNDSN